MLCFGNGSIVTISELVLKHIFSQNSKVHTNQIKSKASKHMQINFVEKNIKWKKREVIKTHGVGFEVTIKRLISRTLLVQSLSYMVWTFKF